MPVLDCPSDPVQGPVKTASDGALGFSPRKAIQNAIRDALEEAGEEAVEEAEDDYECRSGCRLIISSPYRVGAPRTRRPPRRAWWTFWIAYWAEATASATVYVRCVHGEED